ncbi:MAG: YqaE/Pmp3 family membrane protein [Bacteroidia bacterium]|nr:YqaE/Pmp3 family membrane protein [Bacteroidia bacterium]
MSKKLFVFIAFLILGSFVFHSSAALVVPSSSTGIADPDPATVKEAVTELKALSGKEKRSRVRDLKKELKEYKAAKKAGDDPSTNTLLLVILAILLPPLAVYLHEGVINNRFWISLLLTLIFWLPGVIYALIIILGDE